MDENVFCKRELEEDTFEKNIRPDSIDGPEAVFKFFLISFAIIYARVLEFKSFYKSSCYEK